MGVLFEWRTNEYDAFSLTNRKTFSWKNLNDTSTILVYWLLLSNKESWDLNQSKVSSFIERVAKKNGEKNSDRHRVHRIFQVNYFVLIMGVFFWDFEAFGILKFADTKASGVDRYEHFSGPIFVCEIR